MPTTHKWIEVDFDEYTEYDDEGIKVLELPEELPFDESTCTWCGTNIGAFLDERDDDYGRPRAGMATIPTFVCNACGQYACEDCAQEDDHVLQG